LRSARAAVRIPAWPGKQAAGPGPQDPATLRVRVFVYGHASQSEPFHQSAFLVRLGAEIGYLSLATRVSYGERLLLINEVNQNQHYAQVIGLKKNKAGDTEVSVGLSHIPPGFWDGR
jgi:hypothetical protein